MEYKIYLITVIGTKKRNIRLVDGLGNMQKKKKCGNTKYYEVIVAQLLQILLGVQCILSHIQ